MIRYFLLALLAAHVLYLLLFPALAARGATLIGILVSLSLLAGPAVSSRFDALVRSALRGISARQALGLLALFGLPLISLVAEPRIAFWRVDARALVIVAWLLALFWIAARDRLDPAATARRAGSLRTQLFILWSALFWFMLVWDVGVGQAVVLLTHDDRLTTSWELWETRPPSAHLFLAWLSREAFEDGVAYTNHLHPFLFLMYGFSKIVQLVTGLPIAVGRNLTPFGMAAVGVVAFTALIPRPAAPGAGFHATLFLAMGFLLTQWHIWLYPFTTNFDTVFPLIAYLTAIVWASARPRITPRNATRVLATAAVFAAFGWIYTALLILSLWCLFYRSRASTGDVVSANRPLVLASVAAVAVGGVAYALPILLVTLKGYEVTSSSLLFRSGLDGDTRYFQNAAQAVLHPFYPARSWPGLLFPAFVPFLIAASYAWVEGCRARRRFGRESIFLLAPYLFSLALFPQSVSIHPYLYDSLLLLPVVLIGASWSLRPSIQGRLRGATLLATLLLAVLLIMGNLIALAQGLKTVIPS